MVILCWCWHYQQLWYNKCWSFMWIVMTWRAKLFLPWPRSEGSAMTISYPFSLVVVLVLGFQAWHEAKTSCHMHNTPRTPNIFTFSGPPIKWPLEGLIKGAPDPPDPPLLGGPTYFLGGFYWWTIQTPIELNSLGSSWLEYNFSYASRGPDPLSPRLL